jgi:hypothetical protein
MNQEGKQPEMTIVIPRKCTFSCWWSVITRHLNSTLEYSSRHLGFFSIDISTHIHGFPFLHILCICIHTYMFLFVLSIHFSLLFSLLSSFLFDFLYDANVSFVCICVHIYRYVSIQFSLFLFFSYFLRSLSCWSLCTSSDRGCPMITPWRHYCVFAFLSLCDLHFLYSSLQKDLEQMFSLYTR